MDLGLFGAWLAMFADLQVRGLCFVVASRVGSGRKRASDVAGGSAGNSREAARGFL